MTVALGSFVEECGGDDPLCVVGGQQHWAVGGHPAPGSRRVRAPAGIRELHPEEMTVRVGAATTLAELHDGLATHRQTTVLDGPPGATVGGILAVGRSGVRRRRDGPVRDAVLEIRYASAEGRLVVAGGPTVKNVSGYDLCRLMVGSLGTLGCLGEVVLRTRPQPPASQWWCGAVAPEVAEAAVFRPGAVLWDGEWTWALLEGHGIDVAAQATALAALGFEERPGPPPLPPERSSVRPSALADPAGLGLAPGTFVAEMGVGVVHAARPLPRPPLSPEVRRVHRRLKALFDPAGRCNPGRDPLGAPLPGAGT